MGKATYMMSFMLFVLASFILIIAMVNESHIIDDPIGSVHTVDPELCIDHALFAVEEINGRANTIFPHHLESVLVCKRQIVAGCMYYMNITTRVAGHEALEYHYVKVWVTPMKRSELLEHRPYGLPDPEEPVEPEDPDEEYDEDGQERLDHEEDEYPYVDNDENYHHGDETVV
ncbi:hypothetical protein PCE1_001207 [Barthelona sp. PCE]